MLSQFRVQKAGEAYSKGKSKIRIKQTLSQTSSKSGGKGKKP